MLLLECFLPIANVYKIKHEQFPDQQNEVVLF
jgi:hypothetical protein